MTELGIILLIVVYLIVVLVILKSWDWASKRERQHV